MATLAISSSQKLLCPRAMSRKIVPSNTTLTSASELLRTEGPFALDGSPVACGTWVTLGDDINWNIAVEYAVPSYRQVLSSG